MSTTHDPGSKEDVSDTTLGFDRRVKAHLYAQGGM
jgi:hypothetical protein